MKILQMKFYTLLLFLCIHLYSLSQNNLTIFFGNGFENKHCTLTISYWEDESYIVDTLMINELLKDNHITGLTYTVNSSYPKKSIIEIKLNVDDTKYNYRFDRLKNNSELKIEFLDGIDFCLFEKRKFKFY